MLQSIHDRAQGWFAWFIVAIISIPFALWGIQEYLGWNEEPVVATVNGEKIHERQFDTQYTNYRERLRANLGAAYRPDLFQESVLRRQVLDGMIDDQVIQQTIQDLRIRASDDQVRNEIQDIPVFQVGGGFSHEVYERQLKAQGMTTFGFEEQVRHSLQMQQFKDAVTGSAWVSPGELAEQARLGKQTRDFAYLVLPAAEAESQVQLAEGDAAAYYQAHTAEFMAPERVRVNYVEVTAEGIAKGLTADDAALLAHYEKNKGTFVSPEERRASHILIQLAKDAAPEQTAAAQAKAQAALERVRKGEEFAVVAKELSDDKGSAAEGGDLGFFGDGVMVKPFEEAVKALQPGEISEPVRSDFGFHVIRLTEVRAPHGKSFEEAREDVRKQYLKTEGERLFYEQAERLGNLAFEHPESLQPAAEGLGLQITTSDWFGREGGPGALANPKVVNAAFSDDVLGQRNNSEVIDLGPEHTLVLRLEDHEPAAQRPLDAVKAEIEAHLRREKAAEQTKARGEALLARLKAGEAALDAVATETGKAVEREEGASRAKAKAAMPIVQTLFRMGHPVEGKALFAGAILDNGDYALVQLIKVTDGAVEGLAATEKERLVQSIARAKGQSDYEHLIRSLREGQKIEITAKPTAATP